jgi:hypothetical protein
VIVSDERVARFISAVLGFGLCPPYSVIGIERDGAVIAGVLFNCFEGADVHVTAVGTGWTRGFLQAVGEYVYDQLGCERMTFTTEQPAVAALAQRLGGAVEGRLRSHFGPGRDAIVIGVLRGEWKYHSKGG